MKPIFHQAELKNLKTSHRWIRLIRHTFWLFDDIVSKDDTESLRTELKWLLSELAWVENAIQLKTYTSKRHAYYKKIKRTRANSRLMTKELQPSIDDVKALSRTCYNRLLLH